jgi:membrane protease YdiL (CAAX protease family)
MTTADPAPPSHVPVTRDQRRYTARSGLKLYFIVLILLSGCSDVPAIVTHQQYPWLAFEMWSPGAAAIITRLVRKEGFADVSFRFRSRGVGRAITLGALFPVGISFAAYAIGWMTAGANLVPIGSVLGVHFSRSTPAVVQVFVAVVLVAVLDGVFNIFFVLGEELGWRGYMLTRLIDAEVPKPVFVSGLIWGVWHLPVIFGGLYLSGNSGSTQVVAALFLLSILVQNQLMAWLRLRSGSIWPSVAYHATWNAVIQAALDPSTSGPHAWFLLGEQGIILLTVNVAGVFAVMTFAGSRPQPAVR